MQVILLGDYPPPVGGVAIHVQQLERFLRQQGAEVRVLDVGKGGRGGPEVTPCRTPSALLRALARQPSRAVLHVHTSGNNRKSFALALVAGALHRLRVGRAVITLHSGLLPGFLAQAPANRRLARVALANFAKVIAVSPAVKDALVAIGVPETAIVVHPAFLASQVSAGAAPDGFDAVRARRFPLLAMAHHPSKVYGRSLMFEALAKLRTRYPDVGLALFGPGCEAGELEDEARAHGVLGLVERLGELEPRQALAVIARCDAFVRPTTADGDSISVREALTLGVPCVASDAAARPRGTYLFGAGSPDALVDQVCEAVVHGAGQSERVDAGPVVLELYRSLERGMAQPALPQMA
jgi:glycogen(starch) synthase